MANTLLTPVQITREALRDLHNNLVFVKGVNRQYSDEFAKSGAKIGSTVNVRKPNRYFVRTGQAMQTQQTQETYVPLTLNTQWGVDVSFSSQELTLSLDDFSKRILTPAMARLASKIDQDGLAQTLNVWNQVGTPGTTPGTGGGTATVLLQYNCPIVYLNAGMMMDNNACPRDENRRVVINPAAMAQSVAGLSGLFNESAAISEQYRKGVLGHALGFEFAMDQNVNTLTCGTRSAAPTITTNAVTGDTYFKVSGTISQTIKAGEVISVDVKSVNPENQQSTGFNAQFVVTQDLTYTGSSDDLLYVSPSIVLAGASIANGTVATLPTTGSTITLLSGTASTSYPQNIAYHQDAFTLATADLELPRGVDFAARETYDGLSMRIVRAFDITNDMFPCRIDILGGWATLRGELATRIIG